MNFVELLLVLATVLNVGNSNIITVKNDTGQIQTVKLACINLPNATKKTDNLAATEKLNQLLPAGSPVVIRRVTEDEGDRITGEIFVDNQSVNLRLVAEGNAVIDQDTIYYCSETKTQYLIAQANAQNKRLGIWQKIHPDTTKKIPR
ncbi:thermonuclease family protein [Nostoc sp. FACHB-190]|uniref:thermonuclease family protein n=1 Tax=Nostoc sp. FACHB-190 TaxID=2692838 RepID=UPI001683BBB4|nr:thermonuclease family protein [Nostoc sp. FACHB-190]MBD2301455.1 thermonuclease family protein [Nostoc sp. FACHB-190]